MRSLEVWWGRRINKQKQYGKQYFARGSRVSYQHNGRRLFFALLLIASFLGPFGGNMILPMFRVLKHDFAVNVFLLGLSITLFMVPFAVTQLFSGLLSELFYGKRKVIVSGFIIACLGFLLAVFSFNIWVFLASLLRIR